MRDAMRESHAQYAAKRAQIERLAQGREAGDIPRPQLAVQVVELELKAATRAKLRHVRQVLTRAARRLCR